MRARALLRALVEVHVAVNRSSIEAGQVILGQVDAANVLPIGEVCRERSRRRAGLGGVPRRRGPGAGLVEAGEGVSGGILARVTFSVISTVRSIVVTVVNVS